MPNAVLHFATFASPTLLFKKVQVMTKAITISFLKTHQNIRKKDILPATAADSTHRIYEFKSTKKSVPLCIPTIDRSEIPNT